MHQYMYLFYNGKLLVKNIFKYETLGIAIPYLKKKFGIFRDFPNLNKSSDQKEIWSKEEKEIIYELYKKDFIIFNYEK